MSKFSNEDYKKALEIWYEHQDNGTGSFDFWLEQQIDQTDELYEEASRLQTKIDTEEGRLILISDILKVLNHGSPKQEKTGSNGRHWIQGSARMPKEDERIYFVYFSYAEDDVLWGTGKDSNNVVDLDIDEFDNTHVEQKNYFWWSSLKPEEDFDAEKVELPDLILKEFEDFKNS